MMYRIEATYEVRAVGSKAWSVHHYVHEGDPGELLAIAAMFGPDAFELMLDGIEDAPSFHDGSVELADIDDGSFELDGIRYEYVANARILPRGEE